MGLKKSFLCLSLLCLLSSFLLLLFVFFICGLIRGSIPSGGMAILNGGSQILSLEQPTETQARLLLFLDIIQLLFAILLPLGGFSLSILLFYRIKLAAPIKALGFGISRIQKQDLDFSLKAISTDELGTLCSAFETMRLELLRANQAAWRQAEERKRLNAAFAHDLRNPITVLKGTVKLLKNGTADSHALDRLETYTLRIEQYVEAMSSIQRLEEMPVHPKEIPTEVLKAELAETAALLAPTLSLSLYIQEAPAVFIDHGIFLTVAENLIGNAARFAKNRLSLELSVKEGLLMLSVTDDGPGFPDALLSHGPKPFWTLSQRAAHLGMGLHDCQILLAKHGGELSLSNLSGGGARAAASFQIFQKP